MGLHQTKKLLHSEWNQQQENILANVISNKRPRSKIYKNSYTSTLKYQPIQLPPYQVQGIWIDIFLKKMYIWPLSPWKDVQYRFIREMQIKTTTGYMLVYSLTNSAQVFPCLYILSSTGYLSPFVKKFIRYVVSLWFWFAFHWWLVI